MEVSAQEEKEIKKALFEENVKLAAIKWSGSFHKSANEILAGPAGYKDHFSNKKVSSLQFLTEDRVKKSANMAHRILKSYKSALLKSLVREFVSLTKEKNALQQKLKIEQSRPWWAKSNRLLSAMRIELHELQSNLSMLNGIEYIVHTVLPEESTEPTIVRAEPIELKRKPANKV